MAPEITSGLGGSNEPNLGQPTPPLLTILIPTFRRPAELQTILNRYLPAAASGQIEILVSCDGPGDPETERLLQNLVQMKSPGLHVLRHQVNLGLTLHLAFLMAQGMGEYLWLHGDNDLIDEGAIERLIEILRRGNHDLYHLPSQGDPGSPCIGPAVDILLDRFPDSFRLATVIVRRKLLSNAFGRRITFYRGFHFSILMSILDGRSGEILAEPHILNHLRTDPDRRERIILDRCELLFDDLTLNAAQRRRCIQGWWRNDPDSLSWILDNWPTRTYQAMRFTLRAWPAAFRHLTKTRTLKQSDAP